MVGGAAERAANGEKVADAKAIVKDAAADPIGTAAEEGVAKLIGPVEQMKTIEKTASKTVEAFKSTAELATENTVRNLARQGITAALNGSIDAARREEERKKQEKQNQLTPPLVKRSNSQPPQHEGNPN